MPVNATLTASNGVTTHFEHCLYKSTLSENFSCNPHMADNSLGPSRLNERRS